MKYESLMIEFANTRANPAKEASILGFKTAMMAVAPRMTVDNNLKRMDNQMLTMVGD